MKASILIPLVAGLSFPAPDPIGTAAPHPGVLDAIERLNPHLRDENPLELPMKIRSVLRSRNDFFRGTTELFYQWCGETCSDWPADADGCVLLHGDVHPGNMGAYRGPRESDELHFSMVDFDESFRGPFQLDLLRALVSLRFAANENGLKLDESDWVGIAEELFASYAGAIEGDASEPKLRKRFDLVHQLEKEAREEDVEKFIRKFTRGRQQARFRRIVTKKKVPADLLDAVDAPTRDRIVDALRPFFATEGEPSRRETLGLRSEADLDGLVLDVARWTRLSSNGSQGVAKYLVLLGRKKAEGPAARMILQLKEQPEASAVRSGLVAGELSSGRAEFVARAHELFQHHHSIWIGPARFQGREFLIKPKSPWSKEPSLKDLGTLKDIKQAACLIGVLLGRGHAASLADRRVDGERLIRRASACRATIIERSAAAFQHLSTSFEDLRRDARALKCASRADAAIAQRMAANEE